MKYCLGKFTNTHISLIKCLGTCLKFDAMFKSLIGGSTGLTGSYDVFRPPVFLKHYRKIHKLNIFLLNFQMQV